MLREVSHERKMLAPWISALQERKAAQTPRIISQQTQCLFHFDDSCAVRRQHSPPVKQLKYRQNRHVLKLRLKISTVPHLVLT